MPDLVGDHVGTGEIARCPESPRQVFEERAVEIDPAVLRAVEGAHGRAGQAARGVHGSPEEHEPRRTVLTTHPLEERAPGVLRVAEDPGDEVLGLVAGPRPGRGRRRALRGRRGRRPALQRVEHVHGIETEEPADGHDGDEADAAELETSSEGRPRSLAVFEVAAAAHVSPPHREPPCSRESESRNLSHRLHLLCPGPDDVCSHESAVDRGSSSAR